MHLTATLLVNYHLCPLKMLLHAPEIVERKLVGKAMCQKGVELYVELTIYLEPIEIKLAAKSIPWLSFSLILP
jgi:hypothetical protein